MDCKISIKIIESSFYDRIRFPYHNEMKIILAMLND